MVDIECSHDFVVFAESTLEGGVVIAQCKVCSDAWLDEKEIERRVNATSGRSPGMIEGILIDVPAEELKAHIKERAAEHTKKATAYRHQVTLLKDASTTVDMRTSVDPIRDLEYKAKEHTDKAGFFLFMAEHLVMDEVYRLTESDLARLEIAARYF